MGYSAEKWVPLQKTVDVFEIQLANLEAIKLLLGATDVRVAYNRGGTILVEWTMMHRDSFSGLVGQFIVRNDRGEFQVLDSHELRTDFEPYIETVDTGNTELNHPNLGRLLAFNEHANVIDEVIFELPDGSPAVFVRKVEEKSEPIEKTPEGKIKISDELREGAEAELTEIRKNEKKSYTPSPANMPKKNNQQHNKEK